MQPLGGRRGRITPAVRSAPSPPPNYRPLSSGQGEAWASLLCRTPHLQVRLRRLGAQQEVRHQTAATYYGAVICRRAISLPNAEPVRSQHAMLLDTMET